MNKLTKLFRILKNPQFVRTLLWGVAAGVEHEELLLTLNYASIVDIGANRGQFALVSRKVNPQALIYAFEPLAEPASIFRRVFKDDSRVKLFQCAIGAENGQAIIHVSKQDDSSSLLPISARQNSLFPGTEEQEKRTIEVSRLDQVLKPDEILHPGLLKIDVQGYELQVLEGSESLLDCFSYVYVECSFVELYHGQALAHHVIDYLHQHSFDLCGIYNVYYDSSHRAIQGDILFNANR